jgi:hypothetical protein
MRELLEAIVGALLAGLRPQGSGRDRSLRPVEMTLTDVSSRVLWVNTLMRAAGHADFPTFQRVLGPGRHAAPAGAIRRRHHEVPARGSPGSATRSLSREPRRVSFGAAVRKSDRSAEASVPNGAGLGLAGQF